ncbi:MAG TPA: response regulator [Candidatus Angelobacter sp.]
MALTSLVRVLVVDDFEPFRRIVASMVQERPGLHLVGEAADGLEAVHQAQELRPDLILLDIALPGLNGIEAGRRIRKLLPACRILFVSQDSSVEVAQEALNLGAMGYVLKMDAGRELWPALEAVLQGRQFVSSLLAGQIRTNAVDMRRWARRRHEVQFYSNDAIFLATLTRFITVALQAGDAVIVPATQAHHASLRQSLQAHGVDARAALENGSYVPLDSASALSGFMVNGWPDPSRFREIMGGVIGGASKRAEGRRVRVVACGECAPLLLAEGNAEAAIRVEQLWDEISSVYDMDTFCVYPRESFRGEANAHILQRICAEHSAVSFE